jgi:hypothetical protein
MAILYGRAGRLTAKNGGFRPGQYSEKISLLNNNAPGIPRLNLQPYTTSECLHGYATQSSANGMRHSCVSRVRSFHSCHLILFRS